MKQRFGICEQKSQVISITTVPWHLDSELVHQNAAAQGGCPVLRFITTCTHTDTHEALSVTECQLLCENINGC